MTAHEDHLTTRDIANLCGVSPTTVIRWIDSGKLKGFKLPSGHRRALYEEVSAFLRRFDIPHPAGAGRNAGAEGAHVVF